MNDNEFKQGVKEGVVVYSSDGERLGKVVAVGSDQFQIEKGFFFPKEYLARFDEIQDVRADGIYLILGRESLREAGAGSGYEGNTETLSTTRTASTSMTPDPMPSARISSETRTAASRTDRAGSRDDIRVPIVEEQLEAVKTDRQAGEVNVRKHVVTEQKTITVPVTREEVVVERVSAADADFSNETLRVPIYEEEVEVRKRAVLKGEVRVRRETHVEQRAVSDNVRREEVEVDDSSKRTTPASSDASRIDSPDLDDPDTRNRF